ncbi:MAG TPA: DUF3261 domain-containing protein [Pseudomonadales bacterium]|nr:DUF3261 domain-containing protein [Pseudomonadales bacterium]
MKFSTLLFILFLTGCATVQPVKEVSVANGVDMQLLMPTETISLTQKISARYKQDKHLLIMQIQASPQKIVIAGLTPTGTRLFSLSFDGQTVENWQSPLFTAPFDGSYVLADFELATLDIAALRHALPADVTLTETAHSPAARERSLLNAKGITVIRIEYQGESTHYCHLERDYCLQIETLP